MKTISKHFITMLLPVLVFSYHNIVHAQVNTGNLIIIHDAVAAPDTLVVINMEVQNVNNFNGFQYDIPLPEGFSYVQGSANLNPARITNHLIQATVLPGTNIFRNISFSMTSHAYLGNSGILASYTFNTPGQTGSYPFNVQNGILGPAYRENIITGVENGTVFITLNGKLMPGDSNGDGVINVSDVIAIISMILGGNPQPFCIINSDVNRDGNYDVIDVAGAINIIVGGGFYCGLSSISDIEGNIYNTVLIGNQCWMKDNLKTTHYRNGTPIEYPGTDTLAWQNNVSGAYAWYKNNAGWDISYGALYNWHAVNNANGLCPEGWHVPGDAAWTQLLNHAVTNGHPNEDDNPNGAANALKSCRQIFSPLGPPCRTSAHPCWNIQSTHHGFDAFGFSAIPGARRNTSGTFDYVSYSGYYWSSEEDSLQTKAWGRSFTYNSGGIDRINQNKNYGFSVRCVKD